MELEQLKQIWDSENREPLYALNEAGLHAIVQRRNDEFNCAAACRYVTEISIGVGCGVLMLVGAGILTFGQAWLATLSWPKIATSPWDTGALLVAGVIWFYFAAYMNRARQRQQRSGATFESTLRGDLNRAIARVEFQIQIARGILWRGFVPVWMAAGLWVVVVFRLTAAPAWTYVFMGATMLGALVTVIAGKNRAISEEYEPHQRELESLRSKLADPQR
jgi:hypothetical protein